MRTLLLSGAVVLFAVLSGTGCDSTQPQLRDQVQATLDFTGINARGQVVHTWIMYEDSNRDGEPDDVDGNPGPDEFLWCEVQCESGPCEPGFTEDDVLYRTGTSIPWNYSVEVSLIASDSLGQETFVQGLVAEDSLTEYDETVTAHGDTYNDQAVSVRRGVCAGDTSIRCNPDLPPDPAGNDLCTRANAGDCVAQGVCSGRPTLACSPDSVDTICAPAGLGTCDNVNDTRIFVFPDATTRALSTTNREVLTSFFNILEDVAPDRAEMLNPLNKGLCPGRDLEPARAGGVNLPLSFTLNKGDTLLVEARRFDAPPPTDMTVDQTPQVSSTLLVEGRRADVEGDTVTDADSVSFIKFFFTAR